MPDEGNKIPSKIFNHTLSSSAFISSNVASSNPTTRCECTQSGAAAALPSATFSILDELSGKYFLVDTGACKSFLPPSKTHQNLTPYTGPTIITANGDPLKVYGSRACQINLSGKLYRWDFVIANVAMPILGADFLIAFNLAVNLATK